MWVLMDKTGLLGQGWVNGELGGDALRLSRLQESYILQVLLAISLD